MSEATPGRRNEDATSSSSAPSHDDKLCDAGAIGNSLARQVFSPENVCVASDQECSTACSTNAECAIEDVVESRDFSNFKESSRALLQRKQPLLELVNSEEGYVRRLRMVKDCYMPVISAARNPASIPSSDGSAVTTPPTAFNTTSRELTQTAPHPPPVPDDLAARWRIIWGNWIQLCEWHSAFLEKLMNLVEKEPDRIPKLFIDSRSRLRSIYSKYCENHRKAALIAEQYRDYFEELRVYLNDKEDVVSYLMQPVQRIMRYQLPMTEIVKYTERAGSPDLALWKKALDIMKEIPKDTQLILEAARIDGFPGVITALGNILIRGDLLVATTTREQLLETVTGYKYALQDCTSAIGIPDMPHQFKGTNAQSTRTTTTPSSPVVSTDPSAAIPYSSYTLGQGASNDAGNWPESAGLYTGNLKFIESRLFLFEQMLVVTEEVRPKRRVASVDAFAQSTYQFRAAINVNKMRYEAHWYNCSLPNGHTNADAAAVDQLLSTGLAPDDLRFAVLDQTPGRDVVYVIDPITCSNREAWVVQLRDIQRMQHEFLLALQDPRRFKTGLRDDVWDLPTPSDSSNLLSRPEMVHVRNNQNPQHHPPQSQRQRKWPSFTMKRPGRLGSSSSSSNSKDVGNNSSNNTIIAPSKPTTQTPVPTPTDSTGNQLARSLSAERRPVVRARLDMGASVSESKFATGEELDTPCYRKSSLSANSSLKISYAYGPDSLSAECTGSNSSKGAGKKRNVFANLFGRNKSKQRGKPPHLLSPQQSQQNIAQRPTPISAATSDQDEENPAASRGNTPSPGDLATVANCSAPPISVPDAGIDQ
ncbi:hypothetical protein P879_07373 [Paragonimus westermani]|uniref:DH domain-containing protein n=1 Tax=Paragonimus westermani TaxID=34504 RepID=A0A8T0D4M4_9TREM|nr:hypothetical protein P879_07373 [Paragonimus westermani]